MHIDHSLSFYLSCLNNKRKCNNYCIQKPCMDGSRGWTGSLDPPGKSQEAKGSLRNTGLDPAGEAIGSLGTIASRGRFVWLT